MNTLRATDATSATALTLSDGQASSLAADVQNRFLTLLVTQLRNQDPLNPMENAQITSQMAQLSTVQGITQLNNTLLALSGQMNMTQSMQAASLIGKGVLVPGNRLVLGGQGEARQATPFGVDLIAAVDNVVVRILDASGQMVRQLELGPRPAGVLSLAWDGHASGGADLPDGAYSAQFSAFDEAGKPVAFEPLTYGAVSSVVYAPDGLQLDLGLTGRHPMSAVRKVM